MSDENRCYLALNVGHGGGGKERGDPEPTNGTSTDPLYFTFYYGKFQTHPKVKRIT